MSIGFVPQGLLRNRRISREEKGKVFVETVLVMLILIILFFAIFETAILIRDDMYIQRIAREAAREAALTGDVSIGYLKGLDAGKMYFPGREIRLELKVDGEVVIVRAYVEHLFLGKYSIDFFGEGGMTLGSRAMYKWQDTN